MQKMIYNQIANEMYMGLVTILDYETSLKKCLSELVFSGQSKIEQKIIIDLALKSGVNKYRFVTYNITASGEILWNSSEYVTPGNDVIEFANFLLRSKKDIVCNSMLPSAIKIELLQG